MNSKTKIFVGILIIGIAWISQIFPQIQEIITTNDKTKYNSEEKYCEQDEDCIGIPPWNCINRSDFTPEKYYEKYYAELKPDCRCIDNQCVGAHIDTGHSGALNIIFSPVVMLGTTPNETREKISHFISNLGLRMGYISDLNIIKYITIYRKGITEDLIQTVITNPLVKEFEEFGSSPDTPYYKGGLTYLISFKEGLIYKENLREFLKKYPKIKDNLVGNILAIPLQPILVTVSGVPEGQENIYMEELETKYQNEIIEIERVPF